jgi:hypothetical protein
VGPGNSAGQALPAAGSKSGTVGRELGHGGDALVRRVYGHLGTIRHRTEIVEYRVEQFAEPLRERLAALRGSVVTHRCYRERSSRDRGGLSCCDSFPRP